MARFTGGAACEEDEVWRGGAACEEDDVWRGGAACEVALADDEEVWRLAVVDDAETPKDRWNKCLKWFIIRSVYSHGNAHVLGIRLG